MDLIAWSGRSPAGARGNCRSPQTEQPVCYSPWGRKELDTTEVTERRDMPNHLLVNRFTFFGNVLYLCQYFSSCCLLSSLDFSNCYCSYSGYVTLSESVTAEWERHILWTNKHIMIRHLCLWLLQP